MKNRIKKLVGITIASVLAFLSPPFHIFVYNFLTKYTLYTDYKMGISVWLLLSTTISIILCAIFILNEFSFFEYDKK